MTNEQKKLFELLLEVKEICDKNKIDYYLCEYLLTDAIQEGKITGTYHDFSVMIKADDLDKFITEVNKKENRELEGLFNNGKFPGTYFRYVAKDTLYFPIYRKGVYNKIGFAINIKVLKNAPKNRLKSKINTVLEAGIELNNNAHKLNFKRFICLSIVKVLGIIGSKNRGKLIFNALNNVKKADGRKSYMYYKPTMGERKKYPRAIFDKTKTIKLEGVDFKIPADQRYVSININISKKTPMSTFGSTYIIDETIPYEEFLKECKKKKFPKSFYKNRKKLLKKDEKITPYKKYVNKCWDLLYRTEDRFKLAEVYLPQKSNIINLYNNKRFDELEEILAEYIDVLNKYAAKGLCVVFDPIIFQITIDVIITKGNVALARKFIKYAPKEHLLPLNIDLGIK